MKKFIPRLSTIALVLIMLFSAVVGMINLGTFDMPKTYFEMVQEQNADGTYADDYVVLKINDKQIIDTIYLNLSPSNKAKDEKVKLTIKGSSSSYSMGDFGNTEYWNKIADEKEITFNHEAVNSTFSVMTWTDLKLSTNNHLLHIVISSKDSVNINEIVFLNKDKEQIKIQEVVDYKGYKEEKRELTPDEIKQGVEKAKPRKNNGFNIADEQKKFFTAKTFKNTLTRSEYEIVDSAINLINGDAPDNLNATAVLPTFLVGLGLKIFGYNTVGARIIPFIFSILIIGLAFFFGKELFKNRNMGLLFSAIIALSGLLFSISKTASVMPIYAFFILLSYFFMYKYFVRGIKNQDSAKVNVNLLLSAMFFVLAFACYFYAIINLVGLLLLFAIGISRDYRRYKIRLSKIGANVETDSTENSENTSNTENNENLVNAKNMEVKAEKTEETKKAELSLKSNYKKSLVMANTSFIFAILVFFVIIFFSVYLIFSNSLAKLYEETNFLKLISTSWWHAINSTTILPTSNFLNWIVGGGGFKPLLVGESAGNHFLISAIPFICIFGLIVTVVVAVVIFVLDTKKQNKTLSENNYWFYRANLSPFILMFIGLLNNTLIFAFFKQNFSIIDFAVGFFFLMGFIAIGFEMVLSKLNGVSFELGKKGSVEVTHGMLIVTAVMSVIAVLFFVAYPLYLQIPVVDSYMNFFFNIIK